MGVMGKRHFGDLRVDFVKHENEVGQHGAVEGRGRSRTGRERLGSTAGPPAGSW